MITLSRRYANAETRNAIAKALGNLIRHFIAHKNNHPIDGLYAAGVDAGGLYGDTYPVWTSGHAFGWSSYSGRHAALQALQDKKLAK